MMKCGVEVELRPFCSSDQATTADEKLEAEQLRREGDVALDQIVRMELGAVTRDRRPLASTVR
jgi:hypothetical protein